MTDWLSVRIMQLSGIAGHGAGSLKSQWGSTIKSPWVCTVTNQYQAPCYWGYWYFTVVLQQTLPTKLETPCDSICNYRNRDRTCLCLTDECWTIYIMGINCGRGDSSAHCLYIGAELVNWKRMQKGKMAFTECCQSDFYTKLHVLWYFSNQD